MHAHTHGSKRKVWQLRNWQDIFDLHRSHRVVRIIERWCSAVLNRNNQSCQCWNVFLLHVSVRHHITLDAHCDAIKYAVGLGTGDQTWDPSEIWMSSLRTFYTVSCNPFHYTETENGCQPSFLRCMWEEEKHTRQHEWQPWSSQRALTSSLGGRVVGANHIDCQGHTFSGTSPSNIHMTGNFLYAKTASVLSMHM